MYNKSRSSARVYKKTDKNVTVKTFSYNIVITAGIDFEHAKIIIRSYTAFVNFFVHRVCSHVLS